MSDKPLYRGPFLYAGGHPEIPVFGPTMQSKVELTEKGIAYSRSLGVGFKDSIEFTIPGGQILGCTHRREGLQFLNYGSHFVDVTIELNGREFVVQFKATGVTKEKDASKFYTAILRLRHELSENAIP